MKDISISGIDRLSLFGRNDQHLAHIEKKYGVSLIARGDKLTLKGPDASVREANGLLTHLVERMRHGPTPDEKELRDLIHQSPSPPQYDPLADEKHAANTYKATIRARTAGQAQYLESIDNNDIVFAIGPAGTGKTYLAVAMAVAALKQKQISRILLARPAVEAGEKLGFLPGSFEDKVDPYLRPLYDALQDLMEPERLRRMQDMKIIEVVPLAYMRGRTLNESFIILDEAQNTTPQQMKMFLTRLGSHSKAVVTGDVTQTDLSEDQPSGLVVAPNILTGISGLAFVRLNERDVVRNPLVQKIIKAYDTYEEVQVEQANSG
ncbi:MAG: PhoH family protein [Candidatus Latescibacteria bacterium]|jgi:phosphate starvation-inducible PhoH-like protein|nr:PhoH family protein [Candidatus Latescibacterota bacterium]